MLVNSHRRAGKTGKRWRCNRVPNSTGTTCFSAMSPPVTTHLESYARNSFLQSKSLLRSFPSLS